MVGGVSKVYQRSYGGRQLSHHSVGCFWCTLHKCRIVLLRLNVLFCFVVLYLHSVVDGSE
jgi:hypothetical protein